MYDMYTILSCMLMTIKANLPAIADCKAFHQIILKQQAFRVSTRNGWLFRDSNSVDGMISESRSALEG